MSRMRPEKQAAEDAINNIWRATRRHFSAEEKIRFVLEGLRGEESITKLCRRRHRFVDVLRVSKSFWKPARNGAPATRRAPRRLTR